MSLHINRFIDRLKAADARNQRDFTMSVADARDLHADITKLLIGLQEYHERSVAAVSSNPTVNVQMDGGAF
jgi:hypothetical protein